MPIRVRAVGFARRSLRERLLEPAGQAANCWAVLRETPKMLEFIPTDWLGEFPPIGESAQLPDPRAWLRLWFAVEKNQDKEKTDIPTRR